MRYPFLKALAAQPASQSDYKQLLDRTLSASEQMAAELARKNAEILSLKRTLAQILHKLQQLAEEPQALEASDEP